MKRYICRSLVIGAALVLVGASAQATEPIADDTEQVPPTAAELTAIGAQIAAMGNTRGATACSVCHNMDGAGRAAGGIPRLAEQSEAYLLKQLRDFHSGERSHFAMEPVARTLTDLDMQAVALYYAGQSGVGPAQAPPPTHQMALGSWIADKGIAEKGVAGCNSCHGVDGVGLPPMFPRLAGQSAPYLRQQLLQMRDDERSNDPGDMMGSIAAQLTGEEIRAVAEYYEALGTPIAQ